MKPSGYGDAVHSGHVWLLSIATMFDSWQPPPRNYIKIKNNDIYLFIYFLKIILLLTDPVVFKGGHNIVFA